LHLSGNGAVLAVAGLLVGFGTQLGSGCTSGHGVCGIARLSRRSFAATATFMVFGLLTVFVWRHLL
ncbi:MAG TPA: YeeE/YedE thiosulfate transporter family protein, partial [Methylomirabilota bacterium]|nr:YeeE/YedE thiosulfate transporter family protein [Methylomirabilota bacterium]